MTVKNMYTTVSEEMRKTDDMKGVIHICSICHQIIDEKKALAQLEAYAKEYSGVKFSHGLCLKCARLEMAKIEEYTVEKPYSEYSPLTHREV